MKAGLNKIILKQVVDESKTTIIVQEHLKERQYIVIDVGDPRTTLDIPPLLAIGKYVRLVPGTGYLVKADGEEFTVCNFEDILTIG